MCVLEYSYSTLFYFPFIDDFFDLERGRWLDVAVARDRLTTLQMPSRACESDVAAGCA